MPIQGGSNPGLLVVGQLGPVVALEASQVLDGLVVKRGVGRVAKSAQKAAQRFLGKAVFHGGLRGNDVLRDRHSTRQVSAFFGLDLFAHQSECVSPQTRQSPGGQDLGFGSFNSNAMEQNNARP
jgi:hypothetical protein